MQALAEGTQETQVERVGPSAGEPQSDGQQLSSAKLFETNCQLCQETSAWR